MGLRSNVNCLKPHSRAQNLLEPRCDSKDYVLCTIYIALSLLKNKEPPHIKAGTNNKGLRNGPNSPILYSMKPLLVLHTWGKDEQEWNASAPPGSRVSGLNLPGPPRGVLSSLLQLEKSQAFLKLDTMP